MIVIFSVMFVFSIIGAVCRRRRVQRMIILRNEAALIRRHSTASSDDRHHHHVHHHDNTPKTIITGATQVPQVPMGYAPMPQPMLQPVLPYSQPYAGGAQYPPQAAPGYNYNGNYGGAAPDYSAPPGGQANLPYMAPADPYYGQQQPPNYNYGQQPPPYGGQQPQVYM